MAKDLYTVIATAARPELLRRTLTSLAACRKPPIYRGTIVVENGPKGKAEEIVRSYSSSLATRYIYKSEANKSQALNAVLDMIGECLIVFTDDDVRIHPNTLCAYAEASTEINLGKFYGGPTGVDYEREPPEWIKSYLPASARGWRLDNVQRTLNEPIFLGFNWAAFAHDLRDSGGFDPKYGPGAGTGSTGQEWNMQSRMLQKGFNGLYVPEALVWHYIAAERCSANWAIRRAYRNGILAGMEHDYLGPTILGFPRWTIRDWLKKGFAVLAKSLDAGTVTRFEAFHKFRYLSGFMRGSRLARKGLLISRQ